MRITAAGRWILVPLLLAALAGAAVAGEESPFFEGRTIDGWLEAYRTGDATQRQEAYQALRRLRPHATFAIAPLVRALSDDDPQVANVAIMTLVVFADEAVPAVTEALRSPKPAVRSRAAQVLMQIGPKAKGAAPALAVALGDADPTVRQMSVMAIGKIGAADPVLAKPLGALLRDPDPEVRRQAAQLLGDLGRDAKPAVPDLVRALDDPEASFAAARALGRLGPAAEPAVGKLARVAKEATDPAVRMEAVRTLGRVGPGAKAAIPTLLELRKTVQGRDYLLDSAVDDALHAIDPKKYPKVKGD